MPQIRARNLADLVILFRNYGVGKRFVQHSWGETPDCYWTLTKVTIDRIDHRVNRARIYGVLTWKGEDKPETKIKDINKREWAFIPDSDKIGPWELRRTRTVKGQEEQVKQAVAASSREFLKKLELLEQKGASFVEASSRLQES